MNAEEARAIVRQTYPQAMCDGKVKAFIWASYGGELIGGGDTEDEAWIDLATHILSRPPAPPTADEMLDFLGRTEYEVVRLHSINGPTQWAAVRPDRHFYANPDIRDAIRAAMAAEEEDR